MVNFRSKSITGLSNRLLKHSRCSISTSGAWEHVLRLLRARSPACCVQECASPPRARCLSRGQEPSRPARRPCRNTVLRVLPAPWLRAAPEDTDLLGLAAGHTGGRSRVERTRPAPRCGAQGCHWPCPIHATQMLPCSVRASVSLGLHSSMPLHDSETAA